ncbi:MAG: hypothetical protein LRY71_11835 [Bacillaceae bacterium]|nr:hypothetical protein [Bacillaceae bacterium]
MIIISYLFTILFIGLSVGGLIVSRRAFPDQFMFFSIGFIFFVFSFLGRFIGGLVAAIANVTFLSILIGIVCLGIIGYLVWKYDQAFGFVKQEDLTFWWFFAALFLLLGIEHTVLEISSWFIFFYTIFFYWCCSSWLSH